MKKLLFTLLITILLGGCGSSNKNKNKSQTQSQSQTQNQTQNQNQNIIMEKGKSYSVSHGDKIIKSSQNTHIKVTHIDGKLKSIAELIDGNATITH